MKYRILGKKESLEDTAERITYFLTGGTVKYNEQVLSMRDENRNRATATLAKLRRRIRALGKSLRNVTTAGQNGTERDT